MNVESRTAPFIADAASMPGATNAAYSTARPLNSNESMSCPTPMPMENRNSSGSRNPVRKKTLLRRWAR